MAGKAIDLNFGPQSFSIRPLTMSQVCDLAKLFGGTIGETQADKLQLARDAVEIALRRDYPDQMVDDLECDVGELPAKLLAIMQLGGFNPGGMPADAPAA